MLKAAGRSFGDENRIGPAETTFMILLGVIACDYQGDDKLQL